MAQINRRADPDRGFQAHEIRDSALAHRPIRFCLTQPITGNASPIPGSAYVPKWAGVALCSGMAERAFAADKMVGWDAEIDVI